MNQPETLVVGAKTRINLATTQMVRVKSASGGISYHCGDRVATALSGLSLAHVKDIASHVGIDTTKYDHLNPGQQRMNLSNLLRSMERKQPEMMPEFTAKVNQIREVHAVEIEQAQIAKQADADAKAQAKAEAAAKKIADKAEAAAAKEEAKAAKQAEADAKAKAKAEAAEAKEQAKAEATRVKAEAKQAKADALAAETEAKLQKRLADKKAKAEAKAAKVAEKAEAKAAEAVKEEVTE